MSAALAAHAAQAQAQPTGPAPATAQGSPGPGRDLASPRTAARPEASPSSAPGAVATITTDGAVGEETIIIVEGGASSSAPQRARALGAAPFVTFVESADRRGELLSVAEALSATVGAQVRSTGGVGASALLSIRGASAGHTAVLVDGIALSRLTSASVDLGRFRLDELDAVEVYRGNVPAELGGAGVGGAVNLVTHLGRATSGERARVALGVGSFGARSLAARFGDRLGSRLGAYDLTVNAGALTAEGDYRVYSDAGTPLNLADDSWVTRRNNGARQLDASARVATVSDGSPDGDGHPTTLGVRVSWQRHGLPGLIAAPAERASLTTAFAMADADIRRAHGRWAARHRGYVTVEQQRFRDREDEIGLAAQDRQHTTLGAGGSSYWQRRAGQHQLGVGAELRLERFRDRDLWMGGPSALGSRQTVGLSLADELAEGEWLVGAALRLEASRTRPAELTDGPAMALPSRTEVLPSPRVTARVLAERDLALKASAGWYARQPTLPELFGDRGFIVGTPGLRPETGPAFDLGLVWSPARATGPFDRTILELAGFYNHASDAILYVSTGFVTRPLNAGAAQNFGLEASAATRVFERLSLVANYTAQVSEQIEDEPSFDGEDLPRHPGHALYGRAELAQALAGRQLRAWSDAHWTSESFLDRAGLQRIPSRLLLGAGGSVELGLGLSLSLEVKNLLDTRVEHLELDPPPRPDFTSTPVAIADLSGLPLPGRHVFASLEWAH